MEPTVTGPIVWIAACRTGDVPANGGVCVKYGDSQIALFNFSRRAEWYATQNHCPHRMQMALSRGMIGSVNGEPKVACPFHKRTFSLIDGRCFSGDVDPIKTFEVRVENDTVYIGVPAQEEMYTSSSHTNCSHS